MSSKKVINSIQFLRGFAAFVVVIYHIGGYIKRYFPVFFLGDFFGFGFAGVDLFFVISGFIIHFTSRNYLGNPSLLGEYLKKRFMRVYPIYWIVMTSLFCLSWLMTIILQKDVFSTGYPHTFSAYLQTYLLTPLHFAVNPVTWTLSYELFFYLCFSCLIISRRLWVVPATVLLVSLYNILFLHHEENRYFNFIFSGYNLEFMFGFLIYQFYEKIKFNNWISGGLIVISLSIIIKFGYQISDYDYLKRVLTFGLPSAFLLIALLNLEANQAINIPKFSITLGDASYVLYLIHFPMLLLMNKIPMIVGLVLTDVETIWYNYFIIIVIVVVSIIIHKLVEKPLSKYLLVLSKS
jgi:peptidoglycan/LPS O-acetylase OafA/YrhL